MAIGDFFKRRSIRTNIMVSFLLLSVLFMGGIGGISYLLVQRSGVQTITDSTAALEEQITNNIEITAEKNAGIINEKLSSAQSMVEYMASEMEYLFSPENRYGDRDVYYDLWFDNTTSQHATDAPVDTHWDSDYQVDLSWDYASYYYTYSDEGDYDTLTVEQNQTLETVANMDFAFQHVHNNAPEFRWLYITLPFDSGVDLFINYPGSQVMGDNAQRLTEPWRPSLEEDWYSEVLAGNGDIVFTEPYFDPIDGVPLITIGRSVKFDNGTLIGVIFGDISIQTMVDKLLAVQVMETGYAALVTDTGNVVAHPEAIPEAGADELEVISHVEINIADGESALTDDQLDLIYSGNPGILKYTRDGQERFLAYHPVGKGNYINIIILPVDEALAGIDPVVDRMNSAVTSTTTIIWIIAGASLVIGIVVGLTLTAYITKPFNHLIKVAHSLSTTRARRDIMDGLLTEIDPKLLESEDELGELTRAFKGMIDSVQQQEKEKNGD